jgi:pimeloyl-ACP methyl ester carboxylesterase
MRRGFADTSEGQIFYVSEGSGDPVLLLHPSPHSWTHFIDCLQPIGEKYRVIAMDMIGYGDSDRPKEPFTEMGQYAKVVAEVIESLGYERASIAGHMTGAQIAAEVAAYHPERVDKLVLSEVFNWEGPERRAFHERAHRMHERTIDGKHVREIWERFYPRYENLGQDWLDRFFYNVYRANLGTQPDTYGHMGWDGAAPWAMTRTPLWERTPLIEAPTLILHSTNSPIGKSQSRFLETIQRCRGGYYECAAMNGPVESPATWTEAVLEFLDNPGV